MSNPQLSREVGFRLGYIKLDVWFRDLVEEAERIRRKVEDKLKVDRASSGKVSATSTNKSPTGELQIEDI